MEARVQLRELRMELERRNGQLEEAKMLSRRVSKANSVNGKITSVDDDDDDEDDDAEEEDEEDEDDEEELNAQKAIIIARDRVSYSFICLLKKITFKCLLLSS